MITEIMVAAAAALISGLSGAFFMVLALFASDSTNKAPPPATGKAAHKYRGAERSARFFHP